MLFGKGKGDDPLVLLQQGKFKEAAKVLESRLQRSPHDLSLKMRLAEAYEGMGRKDHAAAIYVAEAEADLAGGDRAQALGLLKKASRLLPDDEDLTGRILKLEGQPEESSDQSFSFDVDMSAPDVPAASDEVSAGAPDQEVAAGGPEVEVEAELLAPVAGGSPDEAVEAEAPEEEILEVDASAITMDSLPEGGPEGADETGVPAPEQEPEAPRALLSRLFPELGPSHLDLLEGVSREGWVSVGKVLIREEEAGDSMFVVTSGRLEARGHFDGRELLLATFGPGDIIGEVAFLNRVPRTATVKAVEDSTYLELPGDEVRAQLAEVPETLALLETLLEQRVEKTLQLLKKMDRQHDGNT